MEGEERMGSALTHSAIRCSPTDTAALSCPTTAPLLPPRAMSGIKPAAVPPKKKLTKKQQEEEDERLAKGEKNERAMAVIGRARCELVRWELADQRVAMTSPSVAVCLA